MELLGLVSEPQRIAIKKVEDDFELMVVISGEHLGQRPLGRFKEWRNLGHPFSADLDQNAPSILRVANAPDKTLALKTIDQVGDRCRGQTGPPRNLARRQRPFTLQN